MYKFITSILVVSLLVVGAAGCSNDDGKTKKDNQNATQQKELNIKQNKELTKKVKDEKGVLDGQVYEQDNMAYGTLILDKKVSEKDAKKLAEKYAEELKDEYKGKKVNVQAVRNGKNVANITKE
ncbi:hypothetical protein P4U09_11600 [Bacillus smithii]|nr:hypothetical protein [Bacillus smithii]